MECFPEETEILLREEMRREEKRKTKYEKRKKNKKSMYLFYMGRFQDMLEFHNVSVEL